MRDASVIEMKRDCENGEINQKAGKTKLGRAGQVLLVGFESGGKSGERLD